MRTALAATFVFLFILASPARAEDIVLGKKTVLRERPAVAAPEVATFPAGVKLQVLSRQEGWVAVTTSEGLVGWIPEPRPTSTPASSGGEDTDDLIRSLEEAAEGSRPAEPAPPGGTPAPSTGSTPEAADPPPGPSPPPRPAITPPPPPPPRPPGQRQPASVPRSTGVSAAGGGFYESRRWTRFVFSLGEDVKTLGIDGARMAGRIAEIGFTATGARYKDLFAPGLEGLQAEPVGGDPFGDIVIDLEGDLVEEPVYQIVTDAFFNFFLVNPTERSPIGVYLGGRVGLFRVFGDAIEDLNGGRAGGGGGAFARLQAGSVPLIPRVGIEVIQPFEFDSNSGSGFDREIDATTGVLLGLEASLGGFVPGLFIQTGNNQTLIRLALNFVY